MYGRGVWGQKFDRCPKCQKIFQTGRKLYSDISQKERAADRKEFVKSISITFSFFLVSLLVTILTGWELIGVIAFLSFVGMFVIVISHVNKCQKTLGKYDYLKTRDPELYQLEYNESLKLMGNQSIADIEVEISNAIENKILKFLGCFFLSILASDIILMLIVGDSVEGAAVPLLLLVVAIPISCLLYNLLFNKSKNATTPTEKSPTGLFKEKQKTTVDDMSMEMMHASIDTIGKLEAFDDVNTARAMAVSTGYFYGFLKLHLNSITNLDTVNTIIHKSITHLENATKGNEKFENFGYTVRTMTNNAAANMQYAMKEGSDPFMGMAVFYLNDLYNSTTIDISKVEVAEKNMRYLYGAVSALTKDIKIVK